MAVLLVRFPTSRQPTHVSTSALLVIFFFMRTIGQSSETHSHASLTQLASTVTPAHAPSDSGTRTKTGATRFAFLLRSGRVIPLSPWKQLQPTSDAHGLSAFTFLYERHRAHHRFSPRHQDSPGRSKPSSTVNFLFLLLLVISVHRPGCDGDGVW